MRVVGHLHDRAGFRKGDGWQLKYGGVWADSFFQRDHESALGTNIFSGVAQGARGVEGRKRIGDADACDHPRKRVAQQRLAWTPASLAPTAEKQERPDQNENAVPVARAKNIENGKCEQRVHAADRGKNHGPNYAEKRGGNSAAPTAQERVQSLADQPDESDDADNAEIVDEKFRAQSRLRSIGAADLADRHDGMLGGRDQQIRE